MRTPVESLTVADTSDRLEMLRAGLGDLRRAANAKRIELVEAEAFSIAATLGTS
jgi:hypothetical protein